jgi:hypothetical protein
MQLPPTGAARMLRSLSDWRRSLPTSRFAVSGLLICAAAAGAQEPPKPDTARRPQTLPAVTTTAPRDDRRVFEAEPNVGTIRITAKELTAAPRFFGEGDVLRAVRLLPGVSARNDYSVGMNVRGGEADQNLVLLDGYPVYNPFHVGGLFGSFVEPMVGGLEFHTGGFPARYGGRLSSVLSVESAEEERQGVHGTANVSMVATTLSLGSLMPNERTTWLLAGRRTYIDKVVAALTPEVVPYHFRDAQARVAHRFANGLRLSATWYDNTDHLNSTDGDDAFTVRWGNHVFGTTASRTWLGRSAGDSNRLDFRVSRSAFDMDVDLFGSALAARNTVVDARVAPTLTLFRARRRIAAGVELSDQRFAFRANYPLFIYPADTLSAHNRAIGAFYDEQWKPNSDWILQYGARVDAVGGVGAAFQPRVSAKYFLTPDLAITAAFGTFAQWAHSLAREDIPVRALDFWTGSDSRAPLSRARHMIVGVERWFGTRAIRVEAFHKLYPNLIEQNRHSAPEVVGDEFSAIRGYSTGGDVMLKQFDHDWNGWLAYSFAISSRVDSDGARFRPGQDRRHEVNLVLTKVGPRFTRSMRLNFATGTPYTPTLGTYARDRFGPGSHTFNEPDGFYQVLTGPRNSERVPLASRLDVSLMRNGKGRVLWSPYLTIMNVYNARNPFAFVDDYSRQPPRRYPMRQLPVFPAIGVSIAW